MGIITSRNIRRGVRLNDNVDHMAAAFLVHVFVWVLLQLLDLRQAIRLFYQRTAWVLTQALLLQSSNAITRTSYLERHEIVGVYLARIRIQSLKCDYGARANDPTIKDLETISQNKHIMMSSGHS